MTVSAKLNAPPSPKPRKWIELARALGEEFAATATQRERDNLPPHSEVQRLKDADLLNVIIPTSYGGHGGSLADVARIVFELSKGDASIGMLLAFHYKHVMVPQLLDYQTDGAEWLRRSARNNWFWSNITGTWDLVASPAAEGGFSISGTKKMCTGVAVSDIVAVAARRGDIDHNEQVHAIVPANHELIENLRDWVDYPGLKLTATDTFRINDLLVGADAILQHNGPGTKGSFPPFYNEFGTILFSAIILGSAYGAFNAAAEYTRTKSEPRAWAGVDDPRKDQLTLYHYGDWWIKLETVRALFDRAADEISDAWDNRHRGIDDIKRLAVQGHSLRVAATNVGLDVSANIFGVTGARSLSGKFGLDRFWRDIRMLSTHEPLMYWVRQIGDYALNGDYAGVQFNRKIGNDKKGDDK